MNLSDWRNEIDEIDREMLRLLGRRAEIVVEIGRAKASQGMPVVDKTREAEILKRVENNHHLIFSAESARCVFRCIIKESRRIQAKIIEQKVELC